MDIADRFCKYFTRIGPNLASATLFAHSFVAEIILLSF